MYCNAITTRLLVGRLTPAIRATWFAPVAGGAGRFSAPDRGDNAKCRDDTRPSARAGIGVVLMQNGCRVLKDSNSFRQPLLTTELTSSRLRFGGLPGAFADRFVASQSLGSFGRPRSRFCRPPGTRLRGFRPAPRFGRRSRFGCFGLRFP